MSNEDIITYCLAKPFAYQEYPFGDIPICYKLHGKIFAQLYPMPEDHKITLKCEPMTGDFYRQMYPGIVVRGYHCPPVQQPHWNTIWFEQISEDELKNMIDHAYERVLHSFSKKIQQELIQSQEDID